MGEALCRYDLQFGRGDASGAGDGRDAGDDGGDSVSATDVLAQRIDGVRWRVFGSVPDHVGTPGTKRLRRKLAGPSILSWYPPTVQELHPVFYKEKGQLWKVRRKCVFCPPPPPARRARCSSHPCACWAGRRRREAKGKFQTRKGKGKRASIQNK